MTSQAKFYALYLPQFHEIPENNEWYGKGFTDWRTVTSAKPLFPGHYQPHIPADLGFYDLRYKENLIKQIELANMYGVDGFLYWHYWFGDKKQLLQKPFNELVSDKSINFPFALAWANASWYKKQWKKDVKDQLLIEQKYGGIEDYTAHFYSLLDAFKDPRYIRVDGKLLFLVYVPLDNIEIRSFIEVWRNLAQKEQIGDFYFVGQDTVERDRAKIFKVGFDAVYNQNSFAIYQNLPTLFKGVLKILRNIGIPICFKYKNAINYMIREADFEENTIPVVVPNWDHSPRSGANNIMFRDCHPKYFRALVQNALRAVKNKRNKIIIIKSWNEWAEGNYMEPDLKYGKGYLEELKSAKEDAL